jgi:hypothetical protein
VVLQPAARCTYINHGPLHLFPLLFCQIDRSYPIVEKEAVNNTLATAFNWICFVVAVLLVELGVFWRQHSLTVALAGILHQVWCCLSE